jgi:hypothetical protein
MLLIPGFQWTTTVNGVQKPSPAFGYGFCGFFLVVGIVLQQVRVTDMYRGFTIMLNETAVEKSLYGNKKVLLNIADITSVSSTAKGDIFIYGPNATKIYIPCQIENRSLLKDLLKTRSPIFNEGPYNFHQKNLLYIIYGIVALTVVDFHLTNKMLLIINSTLITGVFIAEYIYRIKSWRKMEPKVRRRYMMILSVFFAAIVAILLSRLVA